MKRERERERERERDRERWEILREIEKQIPQKMTDCLEEKNIDCICEREKERDKNKHSTHPPACLIVM